jgi:integrase
MMGSEESELREVVRRIRTGLSAAFVKTAKDPGYYGDGGGLYLQVKSETSKSWVFRYTSPLTEKRTDMGLGRAADVTLLEARTRARELRLLLQEGKDPIAQREAERLSARVQAERSKTFRQVAEEFMADHLQGITPQQAKTWRSSVEKRICARIGDVLVSDVTRPMLIQTLSPLFREAPVSAKNIQNRVERIMGYARSMGYYEGVNPAEWKDNLDHAFRGKMKKRSNFSSMGRDELPPFYASLSELKITGAAALRLLILTAVRNAEVRGATWSEFDLEAKLWRIPAERMKAREAHTVPLSEAAVDIIREQRRLSVNQFVFPGRIRGRHLSNMALNAVMRRFGRDEDPHGFRTTFKVWARECTEYPDDLSEFALAHKIPEKVKAAYMRTTMLEQRRALMEEWAAFITQAGNPSAQPRRDSDLPLTPS